MDTIKSLSYSRKIGFSLCFFERCREFSQMVGSISLLFSGPLKLVSTYQNRVLHRYIIASYNLDYIAS